MEPASQNKPSHKPWKTEPLWDSQEWDKPIPGVYPGTETAQQPDCSPAPEALDEGGRSVSGSVKTMKVESPYRYEEDDSGEDRDLQPKKKAIWKLLGSTSYPLVPKWASYQKDAKGACGFPGYRNHGSKPYQGLKKDDEVATEMAIDFSKSNKESLSKPKAVFSPMLNSLLTVKYPMPEPIQERAQKETPNHCTVDSFPKLKDDPDQSPMMTSMQSTPLSSAKPRGPYRAKVSPSSKHSMENTQSDSDRSESPEAMPKSIQAPSNSQVLGNKEKDISSQSQNSSDQKTTPESKFLLIDDQGVPYTMMKREMESKPKEEASLPVDEKPPPPKKLHYCLVCFRTFLYLSDLERHSITHSEHKPFECKACGKTFKRSSHLQRHKHIHTGERPFLCPICQKGFRESGELHRHERVHTGEKPFQCELCHLRFTERNTLRRHIKRKHSLETFFQQNLSDWGDEFADTPGEDSAQ